MFFRNSCCAVTIDYTEEEVDRDSVCSDGYASSRASILADRHFNKRSERDKVRDSLSHALGRVLRDPKSCFT